MANCGTRDEGSSRHCQKEVFPAFPHTVGLLLTKKSSNIIGLFWFPVTLSYTSYSSFLFMFSNIFHHLSHAWLKYCSIPALTLFLFILKFRYLPQELTGVIDALGLVKPTKDSNLLKIKKKIVYYYMGSMAPFISFLHL